MNDNNVRPKTKLEAVKWNYYNTSDKWDFIKMRYWPWDIAKAVMKRNLNYLTRFRWFLYLVGNGMDPRMARDMVKKELHGNRPGQDHVDALYKDLKKKAKKWTYWDETLRKTTSVADTLVQEDFEMESRMPMPKYDDSLKYRTPITGFKMGPRGPVKQSIYELFDDDDVSDLE